MQPTYEELLQENQALRERLNKAEIGLYRFEQIVQNMSGIFWIGHPEMDQGMLYTSPRFEEVFGYSFGQIVDVHGTVGNVIHPDDKQRFMDSQKMLFEQGKRDIDYRIIRSDGEVRYLHSHAFMIFNPEIQRQQPAGITEDITEQKLMEQALYESHQRLKLSLSGAQLGSWDWHIATGELQFNDRWATMLGYKPEEIEPSINTWERLIHPDDYDRVMKLLNTHLEGFIPHFQVEYRLRVKSGEWLWVLISGQVFERGTNNQPLRAAGIHLDISQRKKIEDQELQLFSERQRVNVLSNFIRDTSHDLKTPLSLLGTGLYLLRKIDDPERRIAKIDDLEHHLSYLIDVIEQMQKMAILDSVIELTLKPVAVNIVLDELATNTQLRAAHKGITFTYTPIPQSPRAAFMLITFFTP